MKKRLLFLGLLIYGVNVEAINITIGKMSGGYFNIEVSPIMTNADLYAMLLESAPAGTVGVQLFGIGSRVQNNYDILNFSLAQETTAIRVSYLQTASPSPSPLTSSKVTAAQLNQISNNIDLSNSSVRSDLLTGYQQAIGGSIGTTTNPIESAFRLNLAKAGIKVFNQKYPANQITPAEMQQAVIKSIGTPSGSFSTGSGSEAMGYTDEQYATIVKSQLDATQTALTENPAALSAQKSSIIQELQAAQVAYEAEKTEESTASLEEAYAKIDGYNQAVGENGNQITTDDIMPTV